MELPFILDAEALAPEQRKALEQFQEAFGLQCIERRLQASRDAEARHTQKTENLGPEHRW